MVSAKLDSLKCAARFRKSSARVKLASHTAHDRCMFMSVLTHYRLNHVLTQSMGMAEKISLTLGGPKRTPKPSATNGFKRSHAAFREDEDDAHHEGQAQQVSHFDQLAGGAVDDTSVKDAAPLIIAPQANRNWKEASKRRKQRHALPAEAQQEVTEQAIKDLEASKPQYGLNVTSRESDGGEPVINGHNIQAEAETTQQAPPESDAEASVKQKTDDEIAMDALLGKTVKTDLVLPAVSEEEAFERDFREAPDMSSLDDYARVPVDQFGAALLRGMGWKDGEGIGSNKGKKMEKTKLPERRPALLGIGAKEEAAVAQEMGAWGKAARKGAEVKIYNPVLLKDKITGKLYTEEELQKKRENEERERHEAEFEQKEREREHRKRRGEDGEPDRRGERHRRDDPSKWDRKRRDGKDDRDRRRHERNTDEESYRITERHRRDRERDDSGHDRRHYSDQHRQRDRDRDRRR
ncbi:hypothetical protein BAUCODRAFT_39475 [Baudoinia panamericana UAMH 10762]|uniref:Pre-mRNA-splicing factor n=1 Tax=Baudoinia panamericana (strain UAMH 10762) TaxID=717646 RepID=M2MYD4_BAUPA|nr:uncharacterized protein BAUCODRAFT_39475 [Baudoinia panamericana UAMH 10762]EMC91305.1 hypothetical protein BAUCODRAFT_39475 [Baudoinia panamericana UAMH 10762]